MCDMRRRLNGEELEETEDVSANCSARAVCRAHRIRPG